MDASIRFGRILLLSPWSGSISSAQKFSRPENDDHSTNIPGQLAIIAFVIVLVVLVLVFTALLLISRRRRRARERRLAEERERAEQALYEESKKNCNHVLVIFPGDTIGCAERQSDASIQIEEVVEGSTSSGSSAPVSGDQVVVSYEDTGHETDDESHSSRYNTERMV